MIDNGDSRWPDMLGIGRVGRTLAVLADKDGGTIEVSALVEMFRAILREELARATTAPPSLDAAEG